MTPLKAASHLPFHKIPVKAKIDIQSGTRLQYVRRIFVSEEAKVKAKAGPEFSIIKVEK